ncbi:MAG: 50S ribosomal protein L6 [Bacteroidales bacterium]|nr:50S ribosomal protein L6 [Bacteroidales bacterium]
MSRIGKLPISIPEKVTVTVSDDNVITVKGPKGELSQKIDPSIEAVIENGEITFTYAGGKTVAEATKQEHAFHGLYRALVNNMVIGVSTGFTKELELVGVGYRVSEKPNNSIELLLGYTHPIYMQFPAEVKITTKSERNKNPLITLESCNKELLGLICAKIRSFRKPEPYKGKGVKFVGEVIRRKSGKSAGAK